MCSPLDLPLHLATRRWRAVKGVYVVSVNSTPDLGGIYSYGKIKRPPTKTHMPLLSSLYSYQGRQSGFRVDERVGRPSFCFPLLCALLGPAAVRVHPLCQLEACWCIGYRQKPPRSCDCCPSNRPSGGSMVEKWGSA
jgi:hypothetical protein